MKSPEFSTWSSIPVVTKGGSFSASDSTSPSLRMAAFVAGADGLVKVRDIVGRRRRRAAVKAAVQTPATVVVEPIPAWKRGMDCLVIGLLFPLWFPLAVAIAGWIKIVSPGPVFYRQARVGRGGHLFNILKFRSMKVDASTSSHEQHLEQLIKTNAPMAKLDGQADPRIIPGGRCLRAIGLDELPQLLNILMGHMSLVGPRPSTPNELTFFTEAQKVRLRVLPGLTGYWQVSGKNKLTFEQMISLDLQYIARMNFWLDVAIMLATVPAMLLQYAESRATLKPVK
jgi:lipopolysaccharide/colanic/teichoic acid biosynthesis glycosyltransferase